MALVVVAGVVRALGAVALTGVVGVVVRAGQRATHPVLRVLALVQ